MDGSISLLPEERKTLLCFHKSASTHEERLRAHIILLLDQGITWTIISQVLFASASTISKWKKRVCAEGVGAVLNAPGRSRQTRFAGSWTTLVVSWVLTLRPVDFGMVRSRWSCGTIVWLLQIEQGLKVGRETVRRWLRQSDLVYRRPRQVLRPQDPHRDEKLGEIRNLLAHLPANEMAVFQDEVDLNTNPKIGSMWTKRGEQGQVLTPGTNTKRYLAGSLNWRTGELIITGGLKRNAELFLEHLDELRRRFRRFKVIHVICDNARFHIPETSHAVRDYMEKWGHRIKLHYVPTYSPETNPIERVWWHLHEEVTRNHRCPDIERLLDLVFDWLATETHFDIETKIYNSP